MDRNPYTSNPPSIDSHSADVNASANFALALPDADVSTSPPATTLATNGATPGVPDLYDPAKLRDELPAKAIEIFGVAHAIQVDQADTRPLGPILEATRKCMTKPELNQFTTSHKAPVPCLLDNNCLIGGTAGEDYPLSASQKKAAEALRMELDCLVQSNHFKSILAITVTFPDPMPSKAQRERLMLFFKKTFLINNFEFGVTIFDRGSRGRPHYHVIAVGKNATDYRGSFDHKAWNKADAAQRRWRKSGKVDRVSYNQWRKQTKLYGKSAPAVLREMWKKIRQFTRGTGLGRVNALPVYDTKAFAIYFAGCVTNVYRQHIAEDKGVRRVRYWGDYPRKISARFTRRTEKSNLWRGKLGFSADILGFEDIGDYSRCFGHKWFYRLKKIISLVPKDLARARLISKNLPLHLIGRHSKKIRRVETELWDLQELYGRKPQVLSDDGDEGYQLALLAQGQLIRKK